MTAWCWRSRSICRMQVVGRRTNGQAYNMRSTRRQVGPRPPTASSPDWDLGRWRGPSDCRVISRSLLMQRRPRWQPSFDEDRTLSPRHFVSGDVGTTRFTVHRPCKGAQTICIALAHYTRQSICFQLGAKRLPTLHSLRSMCLHVQQVNGASERRVRRS